MLAIKAVLYVLTGAGTLLFAFWEDKLKHKLTDEPLEHQHENVSDFDSFYEIRRDIRRERILNCLPREALFKYKLVVSLKFLLALLFVIEVIFLQR